MSITSERIETLCHVVNRTANELIPQGNLQQFQWGIEAALDASDLPQSWIDESKTRLMVAYYWRQFKEKGYCLKPDDFHEPLRQTLDKIQVARERGEEE